MTGLKGSVSQGVIPAAGRGRRISSLPFTRLLPKVMLPVIDRPIIHHVVDTMGAAGISQIYIVVDSMSSPIVAYFDDGKEFGIEIDYLIQKQPTGIADAILLAQAHIQDDFMVILGDSFLLIDNMHDILAEIRDSRILAVEGVVVESDSEAIKRACSVEIDNAGYITAIVEKPSNPTSPLRGTGLYAFDDEIFDAIRRTPRSPPRNEREITNTIASLAGEGRAKAVVLKGHDININTVEDLLAASRLWLASWRPSQSEDR